MNIFIYNIYCCCLYLETIHIIIILISMSRFIQSAQRRRAGPPVETPTSRVPQTSIKSSSLFANNPSTQRQQQQQQQQ